MDYAGGEIMSTPRIAQKSPIVQQANAGTYYWCSCGASKAQPFCDGSHKGSGFAPLKFDLAEAKTVAWCACKHTKSAPFCDGSHARL
jgi:CDGSH iron-sulfur domain-containing protein 3